jgi:hypothetical protein
MLIYKYINQKIKVEGQAHEQGDTKGGFKIQ